MSEAAFPVMDLTAHGRGDLAHLFLNTYLEASGDYRGVTGLRFYLVYRAMVRAKVELLRATQAGTAAEKRELALAACRNYIALAVSYTRPSCGAVIITHGLSGSGKSTVTQVLIAELGAIRLRSDVERRRMTGATASTRTRSPIDEGIYSPDVTARVYGALHSLASVIVRNGFPVVVDATFLQKDQRDLFRRLAQELRVPFTIVSMTATPDVLRARIASRAAAGRDFSEATSSVLENQIATQESLTAEEINDAIRIDAGNDCTSNKGMLLDALERRICCPA